jgi:Tol biopolymer transport system component
MAAAMVAAGCLVGTQAQQQSPRELFERARLLEENARTLDRAVKLYDEVIAAAKNDRELAAQALLRKGLVLERQGKAEARSALAVLVRDYPDQPDARTASVRLADTKVGSQSPVGIPRLVLADEAYVSNISPDGQYALTDKQRADSTVMLLNLRQKTESLLIAGPPTGGATGTVFSSDGQQVAYGWSELSERGGSGWRRPSSLWTIGLSASAPKREILHSNERVIRPVGWSPDGKSILCVLGPPPLVLAWVAVADSQISEIKRFETWQTLLAGGLPQLSPDGSSIAFSVEPREGAADRFIYVIDAQGQHETAVVRVAASNSSPFWTPDSARLVFVSDRLGGRDLFAVDARSATPQEPKRIYAGFHGDLVGISQTGDLYYQRRDGGGPMQFIAERTASGGRVIQAFKGQSAMWSSANELALFNTGPGSSELLVRSVETGEERRITRADISRVSPRWLRNGREFIIWVPPAGDNGRPGGSYYLVDARSGTFRALFPKDSEQHVRFSPGVLSPDDKTLYLAFRDRNSPTWLGITAVDLATGSERIVTTFPGQGIRWDAPGLAISPDGTTLAIVGCFDSPSEGRIATVRVDGSDFRFLSGPVPGSLWADMLRWTPDGQHIVVASGRGAPDGWKLMQIPVAGGALEFAGINSASLESLVPMPKLTSGVMNIDLSPDGAHLVFSATVRATYELWTIENMALVINGAR